MDGFVGRNAEVPVRKQSREFVKDMNRECAITPVCKLQKHEPITTL